MIKRFLPSDNPWERSRMLRNFFFWLITGSVIVAGVLVAIYIAYERALR
jgi:hypothetical protein